MKTWAVVSVLCVVVVAVSPLAWRAPDAASAVQFVEATSPAGLKFVHNSGRAGKKFLPETMGSGGAFVDLNGDGWLDIVLINGRDWTPKGKRSFSAIYRNNGNGTFTDVTTASGFDVEMYGMGVAAGDYDNDGRDDLYVTTLEGDRLFHNEGNFKFRDVTKASGIVNAHFGTSAAWLDYDRDGKLDVFVANYVQWTAAADVYCSLDGTNKSYCTPESYKGTASKLFHNLGAGKFEDVTGKAGVGNPTSKSLGIAVLDYDGDGWPDIFVANDTQPNKLYRNNGNGTFTEKGVAAGVAFSEDGVARGAMGADAADYDRSGRPHLLVGNFANQMLALYRNEGNGLFVDEAPSSTVGRASLLSLAFGVFFFDYDLDGQQDIFAVNGHIEEEIARVQPKVLYKQIPLMFRNLGKGRFDSVGASLGRRVQRAAGRPGRGLRRLRSRRRSRHSAHQQSGARAVAEKRRRQQEPLADHPHGRHEGQPRRHWRRRPRRVSVGRADADRAQRVELLLTERPRADVRARARHDGEEHRRGLAERHEGPRDRRRGEPVRPDAGRRRDREVAGDCPPYPSEGDCPQARCRPGRSTSTTK